MARLKKTETQRRAERFDEHYRVGKARLKLQEPNIAAALGIGESTLRKYKRNPMSNTSFSFGQVVRLGDILGWSDEDFLDIIRAQK